MSNTFNTTPANWQGVDDVPTAGSDNLIKSGGVESELYKKVDKDGTATLISDQSDEFVVADENGNIMAKIDEDGIDAVNIRQINTSIEQLETDVSEKIDKESPNIIISDDSDTCYFTDENGYVMAKIDEDGIHSVKSSSLELFSVGDSLSESGQWQEKVSEVLGVSFDNSKNANASYPTSIGGTLMFTKWEYGNLEYTGMARAMNLSQYLNAESEGVVILECVNDFTEATNLSDTQENPAITSGTIDDKPFMLTQIINKSESSALDVSLLNSIAVEDRKYGTAIKISAGSSQGYKVSVNSVANQSGNIIINMNSSHNHNTFTIAVSTSDTAAQIAKKIGEVNYADWSTKVVDNEVEFYCYVSGGDFTVNAGTTGVSITKTSAAVSVPKYYVFKGDSLIDWSDTTKWHGINTISFYSAWKGIINYINTNFPKIRLFVLILPEMNMTPSEFKNSDGTYDMDAYMSQRWVQCRRLVSEAQRTIAKRYNIPIIDLEDNIGVNIGNYSQYYYDNNTHPKDAGYELWGNIIGGELKKYIN